MPEPSALATLGWAARGLAIASKSHRAAAEDWMISNGAPSQALRILKSPVGAGSSSGADLGDTGVAIGAWSEAARTTSAFYRMLGEGFVRVPVRTRVGISVSPVAGSVVAEGASVPLSPIQIQNVLLEPVKVAALLVVTDELLRDVSASGQMALNRALLGAVSDAVDAAFLEMITDTGTLSIASSGATAVNAKTDLRKALMAVNTIGSAKLFWIAGVDVAKRASTLATTDGGDAFVAMSASGGELANLPAIVSSGVPADSLLLLDASGIAADGGAVTVAASSQADVLMDSVPGGNSTTPTPAALVSTFQTNSTALKASAWLAAQLLRDDAVAEITGIAWGGA